MCDAHVVQGAQGVFLEPELTQRQTPGEGRRCNGLDAIAVQN